MVYTRGQRHDFDSWNTKGWSADELLPFLKKVCFGISFPHQPNHTHPSTQCLLETIPEGLESIQIYDAAGNSAQYACLASEYWISQVTSTMIFIAHYSPTHDVPITC
jgi:choline dehydrogenase-like flavoprotein